MEKQWKIPVGDGKYIYGVLRGKLSNPLVVFVHGFTGDRNEHQFFNGARFFERHGISTFRFNLYDWKEDARKLEDCTLSLHGKDLDIVIAYFREKAVKKIYVVGHSFGGVTILLSQEQRFDAAILWDATDDPNKYVKPRYIKELELYYNHFDYPFGFTIGKEMIEENKNLKPIDLIKGFRKPIKIIVAGSGVLIKGGRKMFLNANRPKDFAVIPNATHCFDEDETEEKLFEETLKWIKK